MTDLSQVYTHPGPFATVYLDATRATESGAHEVALRWRALRGELEERGAEQADLAALDTAIEEDRESGTTGLVLAAAGGQVVFRSTLPRPPVRELAHVAPLPLLMPYFAQRGSRTRYLTVTVDRTGAEISAAPWLNEAPLEVAGSRHPVHKTGRNTWDERHFQHRVENAWEANARDVADAVVRLAAEHAIELVVVTGDPRARALLVDQLGSGLREGADVVWTGEQDETVHDAVLRHDWRQRRELLEHLRQNIGRDHFGVMGVVGVVDALRAAAVDTLIISDDPSSTLTAYLGPEPTHLGLSEQDLHDIGVAQPMQDRLDSALVRAAIGTGARLHVTPNAHEYMTDGIGALLRYDERPS